MTTVQNVGTTDYAYGVQDYQQPEQYDMQSMPEIYDQELEQKKSASKNMLGLTALGTLAVAGIGYGINRHMKVSGLKDQVAALEKEAKNAKEEVKETLNEYRTAGRWKRFVRWFNPNYKLTDAEKAAREEALKAKKEAAEAAKKEAAEAKKADKK